MKVLGETTHADTRLAAVFYQLGAQEIQRITPSEGSSDKFANRLQVVKMTVGDFIDFTS